MKNSLEQLVCECAKTMAEEDIELSEAYHRTEAEQARIDNGGYVDGFPFVGKDERDEILRRLIANGKVTDNNPDKAENGDYIGPYRQMYGSKKLENGRKVDDYEEMVQYALENPDEAGIFDDDFGQSVLDPKQHQLAYGRDETEVKFDVAFNERLEKMGRRFGLDVRVEQDEPNEELYSDAEDLDYASFKDMNAFNHLFKTVSSMFRKAPGHSIVVPPKKDSIFDNGTPYVTVDWDFCKNYVEKELDREFARKGGKLRMPWTGGMVNGVQIDSEHLNVDRDSASETAMSILKHINRDDEDDGKFGKFLCGRIVTQQQYADTPFDTSISEELKGLSEYIRQDGYHTGVHWSFNMTGWIDDGEYIDGMSLIRFQGYVPISSIDWANTVATNQEFPNEKEIWLYPGRPILNPWCSFENDRILVAMSPIDKNLCLIA